MYADHPPVPNAPVDQVIVLEGGEDADEVVEEARGVGAVAENEGTEIFWVVFANDPRRMVDLTESALRKELKKKPKSV